MTEGIALVIHACKFKSTTIFFKTLQFPNFQTFCLQLCAPVSGKAKNMFVFAIMESLITPVIEEQSNKLSYVNKKEGD